MQRVLLTSSLPSRTLAGTDWCKLFFPCPEAWVLQSDWDSVLCKPIWCLPLHWSAHLFRFAVSFCFARISALVLISSFFLSGGCFCASQPASRVLWKLCEILERTLGFVFVWQVHSHSFDFSHSVSVSHSLNTEPEPRWPRDWWSSTTTSTKCSNCGCSAQKVEICVCNFTRTSASIEKIKATLVCASCFSQIESHLLLHFFWWDRS